MDRGGADGSTGDGDDSEGVLREEHPSTLSSIANLASTYWSQGRWKKAEEIEVQVIETRRRILGKEHPNTLTTMNNLVFTMKEQGRKIRGHQTHGGVCTTVQPSPGY